MRLRELARQVYGSSVVGDGDPELSGLTPDSRTVDTGFLFAAIPGNAVDGGRFIDDALAKGAAAVLMDKRSATTLAVPVLAVDDPRRALGEAAAAFYRHPSRDLRLVGVTGTNGKTSTAYILRHILNHCGIKTGMLGTIEYDLGGKLEPSPLTTPDAVSFTRNLAAMRDNGCAAAVVEVSSHALSQSRVWPNTFSTAIFTNLTRDHLDYHGNMENYLEAKRILFRNLETEATAVVNLDDPASERIAAGLKAAVYGYTLRPDGAASARTAKAAITKTDLSGQTFTMEGADLKGDIRINLIGEHNVANFMGAILAAYRMDLELDDIAEACASFAGVPGRLERLEAPNGAAVFVDYSHTDGALQSVLSILRPLTPGKIVTVFGCGGDRDRGKRPLMAKAAEQYSDLVVVTSDNPRTEDPDAIIADIMPGFSHPERVRVEADRAAAIGLATATAGANDAVLIAGKGHEDYQIVGTVKHHLDDRELVRESFAR